MKALPRIAARICVAFVLIAAVPLTAQAAPCAGFTDVDDTSPFCVNVAWLKNRGITLGCTATLYCPNDPVTRLQMAIFMNRLADSLFPLTCASGQIMKWNGSAWACANDNAGAGGGTLTSVMAGTGLQGSPNPITGAGSLNIAPAYQLPQSCASGQVAKSNGSGGWICAADSAGVTSVATGTGLSGGPITATGTISADTTYLQRRVAGTCAAGSSIRTINTDGTVVCETDDGGAGGGGTVTSVATGTGLTGGPILTSGTVALAAGYQLPQACANGQVPKSNGSGGWTCAADNNSGGTVTSVAGGTGLTGGTITGAGTLSVNTTAIQSRVTGTCAAGSSIRTINTDGSVVCEADDTGGGGGTVTSVGTGTGLTGGPITTSGTIAVNTGVIQSRVSGTCAAGSSIRTVNTDGTVVCQTAGAGTVSSLSQGAGITLSTNPITTTGTITADTAYLQRRVTGTCAAGSSIRTINTDGTVVCETDDGGGAANAFVQGGNAFGATASLGTNDSNALELRAGNARVMRFEHSPFSPNVVGGSPANVVTATVRGATISGGGVPAGENDPTLTDEAPNRVTDIYGTIGGGYGNRAGDATGTVVDARSATVAGGSNNIAAAQNSAVGGGSGNSVSGTATGGTVSGGMGNVVFGSLGVIAGGVNNIASGTNASLGGGSSNFADGLASTVAGGTGNTASGIESTVSGGGFNFATGVGSTVPGGELNTAGGSFSFAAGRRAKVRDPSLSLDAEGDEGTFVWADSTDADFESTGPNQFLVRASGGVGINTAQPGAALHVRDGAAGVSPAAGAAIVAEGAGATFVSLLAPSTAQVGIVFGSPTSAQDGGVIYDHASRSVALRTGGNFNRLIIDSTGRLAIARASTTLPLQVGTSGTNGNGASLSATGVWTNASSRGFKEGFDPVDGGEVLERVVAMPITAWNYTGDTAQHIGPTAEDFKAAFGLGGDERYIGTVDADGVALAAIQGLNAKLVASNALLAKQVAEQAQAIAAQSREVATLRQTLMALLARLDPDAAVEARR